MPTGDISAGGAQPAPDVRKAIAQRLIERRAAEGEAAPTRVATTAGAADEPLVALAGGEAALREALQAIDANDDGVLGEAELYAALGKALPGAPGARPGAPCAKPATPEAKPATPDARPATSGAGGAPKPAAPGVPKAPAKAAPTAPLKPAPREANDALAKVEALLAQARTKQDALALFEVADRLAKLQDKLHLAEKDAVAARAYIQRETAAVVARAVAQAASPDQAPTVAKRLAADLQKGGEARAAALARLAAHPELLGPAATPALIPALAKLGADGGSHGQAARRLLAELALAGDPAAAAALEALVAARQPAFGVREDVAAMLADPRAHAGLDGVARHYLGDVAHPAADGAAIVALGRLAARDDQALATLAAAAAEPGPPARAAALARALAEVAGGAHPSRQARVAPALDALRGLVVAHGRRTRATPADHAALAKALQPAARALRVGDLAAIAEHLDDWRPLEAALSGVRRADDTLHGEPVAPLRRLMVERAKALGKAADGALGRFDTTLTERDLVALAEAGAYGAVNQALRASTREESVLYRMPVGHALEALARKGDKGARWTLMEHVEKVDRVVFAALVRAGGYNEAFNVLRATRPRDSMDPKGPKKWVLPVEEAREAVVEAFATARPPLRLLEEVFGELEAADVARIAAGRRDEGGQEALLAILGRDYRPGPEAPLTFLTSDDAARAAFMALAARGFGGPGSARPLPALAWRRAVELAPAGDQAYAFALARAAGLTDLPDTPGARLRVAQAPAADARPPRALTFAYEVPADPPSPAARTTLTLHEDARGQRTEHRLTRWKQAPTRNPGDHRPIEAWEVADIEVREVRPAGTRGDGPGVRRVERRATPAHGKDPATVEVTERAEGRARTTRTETWQDIAFDRDVRGWAWLNNSYQRLVDRVEGDGGAPIADRQRVTVIEDGKTTTEVVTTLRGADGNMAVMELQRDDGPPLLVAQQRNAHGGWDTQVFMEKSDHTIVEKTDAAPGGWLVTTTTRKPDGGPFERRRSVHAGADATRIPAKVADVLGHDDAATLQAQLAAFRQRAGARKVQLEIEEARTPTGATTVRVWARCGDELLLIEREPGYPPRASHAGLRDGKPVPPDRLGLSGGRAAAAADPLADVQGVHGALDKALSASDKLATYAFQYDDNFVRHMLESRPGVALGVTAAAGGAALGVVGIVRALSQGLTVESGLQVAAGAGEVAGGLTALGEQGVVSLGGRTLSLLGASAAVGLVATGALMALEYQRGETIIAAPELDKFK